MQHPMKGDIVKGKCASFGSQENNRIESSQEYNGLVVNKYILGGEILYEVVCEDNIVRTFSDYEILEVINETRNI